MPNISSLTALRGVAAWLVVVYHFREALPKGAFFAAVDQVFAKGFLAVDLFFLLSGFILYLNYAASFTKIHLKTVWIFYAKRVARIYPLHLTVLLLFLINPLVIALFSTSGTLSDRYDPWYFLMSIFLIQNWGFTHDLAWNVPSWSISTEFAAYLLFPFAAACFQRLNAFSMVAVYAALSFGLYQVFSASGYASLGGDIASLGLYRCLFQFLMGMLLAWLYLANTNRLGTASRASVWLGVVLWLAYTQFDVLSELVFIPWFFSLLIVHLLDDTQWLARLLASPILIYLGEVSYSTYLIHYLLKDWIKFVSSSLSLWHLAGYLLAVLLCSMALYRLIELPARAAGYALIRRKVEV